IKTLTEVATYKKNGTFEIFQFSKICYWYISNIIEALSYFVKALLKPSGEAIEVTEDVIVCKFDQTQPYCTLIV
ncbi:960_t:CDS:2, partial [Gigaspora margarita]